MHIPPRQKNNICSTLGQCDESRNVKYNKYQIIMSHKYSSFHENGIVLLFKYDIV